MHGGRSECGDVSWREGDERIGGSWLGPEPSAPQFYAGVPSRHLCGRNRDGTPLPDERCRHLSSNCMEGRFESLPLRLALLAPMWLGFKPSWWQAVPPL